MSLLETVESNPSLETNKKSYIRTVLLGNCPKNKTREPHYYSNCVFKPKHDFVIAISDDRLVLIKSKVSERLYNIVVFKN